MNRLRKAIAEVAICMASLGVAHAQEQIMSDYDHNTNFSRYKTYSWQKVDAPDEVWESRLKSTVDAQLAAKGWTRVDAGGDAVIIAEGNMGEAAAQERVGGGGWGPGWGAGWRWRGWTEPVDYNQGILVIDILDGTNKALIWRSFASENVSSKEEKSIDKLDKAVVKLFKNFPPKN
jgi:hypothetical protein